MKRNFKKVLVVWKKLFTFALANREQWQNKIPEDANRTQFIDITYNNQIKKNQSVNFIIEFEYRDEQTYNGEFDPGSGWTLAGGLTHASRAVFVLRDGESGVRVRNTCATCLYLGDSLSKGRLIPHNIWYGIVLYWKLRWIEMGTRKIR